MHNKRIESDKVYAFIKDGNVHGYFFHEDYKKKDGYEVVIMDRKEADKMFEKFFFGTGI